MSRPGTTKAHGQKHTLDKFYTKSGVAQTCLAHLELQRYARIIEPSAGAGAFSTPLQKARPGLVVALDLAPETADITPHDWFDYRRNLPKPTLVVGNPPFGQQGALAMRFINHAFETVEAETVAFILPRSFRKASVQNRVFRNATLTYEIVLPRNSFELAGDDYEISTVFQIWERSCEPRPTVTLPTTSPYFQFTKKDEPHDFAVRRVGGRAGCAFSPTTDASPQSNYFLKVGDGLDPVQVQALINSLDFSVAEDGTGPKTLSKRELVAILDAGLLDSGTATPTQV